MAAPRKKFNIKGKNLWYLVGLITSDGSLSKDGRHIDITAKEYNFLHLLRKRFGISNRVRVKNKGTGKEAYRIQISNTNLYDYLLSIGLMSSKSLVLGKIDVPKEYFVDFLRGLIDGDGCIRHWAHPSNKKEQWSLRIYSGSGTFLEWLSEAVKNSMHVQGKVHREAKTRWILKYGKMAARKLLKYVYYNGCVGLHRKTLLARGCINSYRGLDTSKRVNVYGRPG